MRTTIDIPDPLFKELKSASALRGESLKQYITAALLHYRKFDSGTGGKSSPKRVRLPLVGKPGKKRYRPTGADLEQALAESENLRSKP